MALQATEQGSRGRPPPSAADTDRTRRPLPLGGAGCSFKRAAVAGLPDDALVEILSRLHAKYLCRSKCVSKAWRDLIADRLRCRKLPLTLEGCFYGCEYLVRKGPFCNEGCCDSFSDSGDDDDESGSEGSDEGVGEDSDEGGSDGSDECSSEDDKEGGSKNNDRGGSEVCGHFINLLGRSAPLVDPSFSFLRKHPGIKNLTILDSCNGLLLFGQASSCGDTTSYIVCNPATEHWVPVPSSGFSSYPLEYDEDSDEDAGESCVLTCLIFDPVISPHFQLIEFCHNPEVDLVLTYSSKAERWGDRPRERRRWKKGGEWDLHRTVSSMRGSTLFNKLLHLIVSPSSVGPELIAAIDGKGKTRKVLHWDQNHGFPVFMGQSKGLLHCLSVWASRWQLLPYD